MITLEEALATGRGIERAFCCPAHDDRSASASVNVVKGVWVCYACAAHGTLEGYSPSNADLDRMLKVLFGNDRPRVRPESWLDLFDADHVSPYWARRFGFDTAAEHRCGTHPLGMPTYPLRDAEGRVWGVVTRHEDQPKYRYPANASVSQTLFGQRRKADVAVLVEGAGDRMAIAQAGIPDNWVVLGVFGAGLRHPQITLLAECAPEVVIAAFDSDEAGLKAAERAVVQLHDYAPVLSHPWSNFGGKDAAEVPVHNRIESLRTTLRSHHYAKVA